jgi:pimeloyl-ACP methyl ester carboxylesterase
MTPDEQVVDVRGTRVRVLSAGSGPPLLYLHSFLDELMWQPLFDNLSREFRIYVPENPAFTTTENLERLDSVHDLSFHYADLLDLLKMEQAYVVGVCVGGWIAAEFAVHYPNRLLKLVLIDALGLKLPGVFVPDIFAANPSETRALLFKNPDSDLAHSFISDAPSPEMLDRMLASRQALARIGWNPYLHDPKLEDRLYRVRVPTLVSWGDADRLLSIEHARLYADKISGARLVTIKDCGHLPILEKVHETANCILEFLKS